MLVSPLSALSELAGASIGVTSRIDEIRRHPLRIGMLSRLIYILCINYFYQTPHTAYEWLI